MAGDMLFKNGAEWRRWLEDNWDKESQVWLMFYKKHSGGPSLTLGEAVDEALCFGWIDGILHPVDAQRFRLRFSPRRRTSVWSQANVDRVERLIAEGRMTEAGLRKYKERPDLPAASKNLAMPPDALELIRSNARAWEVWSRLNLSAKSQYAWWIISARKAVTRERRLAQLITQLSRDII